MIARPDGNFVLAAVALPPPLHGQSLVNAAIVAALSRNTRTKIIDLSPNAEIRTITYHLRRLRRVLRAIGAVCLNGIRPRRAVYTVVEAGKGIAYTILLVGIARLMRYRVFLHHHASNYLTSYSFAFELLSRIAGSGAIHIVGSPWMARDLQQMYRSVKRVMVSTNVHHIPEPAHRALKLQSECMTIGILSNLTLEKGVEKAIRVVDKLNQIGRPVSLVLAGPIVGKNACTVVDSAVERLGSRIAVLGPVFGDAKDAFFRSIDVFIFPTTYRHETHGLVVFEAMSYGIPVIVNETGYTAEFVFSTGILIRKDQDFVREAVRTICNWRDYPDNYSRQSRCSYRTFRTLHNESIEQYESLLNVLSGCRDSR